MSSSKTNDELQSSATPHANNVEELTYENSTEACVQDEEHQSCDPADFEECAVSKEYFCQPEQSEADPKCANNDTVVSMEISISDECSLFQSSEGSVSSCSKIRGIICGEFPKELRQLFLPPEGRC